MESRVMYQPSTGWITIHISAYHTWQGHISDVPYRFLGLICSFLQNSRVGKLVLPTKETIVTEKVT